MRIGRPRLESSASGVEYRVPVETRGTSHELWFRVEREHGELLSERADAALLGLVLPAMMAGEDIDVEGVVSPRLHYHLSGPFQRAMQLVLPALRTVELRPDDVAASQDRASGVATGFSAGMDSFSVVADHHGPEASPGFRLTHLVYNNVGSHGREGNPLFRMRYDRLRPAADAIGLPFVAIDSNLMSFYTDVSFKHSYTVRNATVALLLQAGIGRSLHAAGTVLGGPPPRTPINDVAYFDPVLLPMMSTESVETLWTGGHHTRAGKTLRVADLPVSWRHLDVCVRNDRPGNCSTCKKCVRTLLTLEIAGLIDRYAEVFDLAAYRKHRHWRVARILRTGHQNSREIRALASERGYRFPLRERAIARLRLDGLRDWVIEQVAKTERGGRRIRERKARRPGAISRSLPGDGSALGTSSGS